MAKYIEIKELVIDDHFLDAVIEGGRGMENPSIAPPDGTPSPAQTDDLREQARALVQEYFLTPDQPTEMRF